MKNPLGGPSGPKLGKAEFEQLGDPTEGCFWISLLQACKNFEVFTVCAVEEKMNYSWLRVAASNPKTTLFFECTGKAGSSCHVSLTHQHIRHVQPEINIMKIKYGVTRLIAFKIDSTGCVEVLGYGFHSLQLASCKIQIPDSGKFYVLALVDFKVKPSVLTLSANNEEELVHISRNQNLEDLIEKDEQKILLQSLFKSVSLSKTPVIGSQGPTKLEKKPYKVEGIERFYGQALGFVFFFYVNKDEKAEIVEEYQIKQLENVKEYFPFKKIDKKGLNLLPGHYQAVILKFGSDNNCSHISRINTVTNYINVGAGEIKKEVRGKGVKNVKKILGKEDKKKVIEKRRVASKPRNGGKGRVGGVSKPKNGGRGGVGVGGVKLGGKKNAQKPKKK